MGNLAADFGNSLVKLGHDLRHPKKIKDSRACHDAPDQAIRAAAISFVTSLASN
jgi:hypothetical protein